MADWSSATELYSSFYAREAFDQYKMASPTLASNYHTTTAGTRLHYLRTGSISGPLLLCLHGLGGSTDTFTSLVPHLPQTYDIVLVDFPGFGKTPLNLSLGKVSIAGHVADLGDLILALQGASSATQSQEIVIVGHSLGAIVALHYAAAFPENIGGMVLLGVGRAAGHIPAARQRMLDLAAAVRTKGIGYAADVAASSNFYNDGPERTADASAREAVKLAVLASDPEGYIQTCEAIVDEDHKDPKYEKIIAPVVLVVGDLDMISPIERSRDVSALLGGTSWVQVVTSGHQPILEDLHGTQQAVDKLLCSVRVCSAARAMKDP
ncbi:alpha/beta-hydrolase [Phaeosphaeriaceae sp. SRC1lsM3a]|nr:alpha/beta-hydrolase [Stagonospora sp. SRC1lsM3a]